MMPVKKTPEAVTRTPPPVKVKPPPTKVKPRRVASLDYGLEREKEEEEEPREEVKRPPPGASAQLSQLASVLNTGKPNLRKPKVGTTDSGSNRLHNIRMSALSLASPSRQRSQRRQVSLHSTQTSLYCARPQSSPVAPHTTSRKPLLWQ